MTIGTAHLSCRELVELVTEYLEGALSRGDRMRFETHIANCDGCTEYLEQIRRTIALTGELKEDDVPAGLLDAFRNWHRDR
jgi:anti-sigma factor RsiW